MDLYNQAIVLIALCAEKSLKLAVAESCTGGLVAGAITEIAGASAVFEGGFITYSNELKIKLLGVEASLIEKYGAVSEQVAAAMAKGALEKTGANVVIAITGIAGPSGGTPEKPIGLVYIAVAANNVVTVGKKLFSGNRHKIREQAVASALELCLFCCK